MKAILLIQAEKCVFNSSVVNRLMTRTFIAHTVDSRYLEIEGTLINSSRYPYFDISDL